MTVIQRVQQVAEQVCDFVTILSFIGMAGLMIFFGGTLILSALDGAHVIPNLFLEPGASYSASKAIGVLSTGEGSLILGVILFWSVCTNKLD